MEILAVLLIIKPFNVTQPSFDVSSAIANPTIGEFLTVN